MLVTRFMSSLVGMLKLKPLRTIFQTFYSHSLRWNQA